jgi:hypothetical protein
MMKKIGELEVTDKSKLVLQIGGYKDKGERIDLRMYTKIKDEDKYIPTKKGIFFDAEWLPKFIIMIEKLKDL